MLNAYAQSAGPSVQTAPSPMISLMPIILIFIIFYFLLIRPQKKTQEDHKKMVEGLKKNDEVITSGGIHGTIVNVKESSVVLRVDDNVKIEVQKVAVATLKKSHQA
ncbi:MAG: preprotein translocase subunit YajC [Omnitrophica bacterium RBG_13_46_9]|nr:MAG: preprotein translocase subunit YajC [Omnitrophica bacterium RBG_13_46_9]